MATEIRILRRGDESVLDRVAPHVFDHAVDPRATADFLSDERHHLAVAIEDGVVVAFASALHYLHPDQPRPELWINEIGVASTHRRRGLGKAVLRALCDVGRELGCSQAWVLTDRKNPPAMRLYRSAGGLEASHEQLMYCFPLDRTPVQAAGTRPERRE
jgi:aminoglycoside 6'-N-acetyltransferase I